MFGAYYNLQPYDTRDMRDMGNMERDMRDLGKIGGTWET